MTISCLFNETSGDDFNAELHSTNVITDATFYHDPTFDGFHMWSQLTMASLLLDTADDMLELRGINGQPFTVNATQVDYQTTTWSYYVL